MCNGIASRCIGKVVFYLHIIDNGNLYCIDKFCKFHRANYSSYSIKCALCHKLWDTYNNTTFLIEKMTYTYFCSYECYTMNKLKQK